MSFSLKSTHIDRDDFDADHYADLIRDAHRSRLTLDQLDIANRHLRKQEKFLTHIHGLKMKEHTRVKNDFIRKVEQDSRLSNIPSVKETLIAQRRKRLEASKSASSNEQHPSETTKQEPKSQQLQNHSKSKKRSDTPRTGRLKANLNKFNHTNKLFG
jgi:hypothetical protein